MGPGQGLSDRGLGGEMAWKIEQWMRDVFPGADRIYEDYRGLPRRELAITAGAVLDLALVEILSMTLTGPEQEIHSFLGINGDGRAPCGSFGARIQLALLLSIISERDAAILRAIKNIRNQLAHQVNIDFDSSSVLPLLNKLHDNFQELAESLKASGSLSSASRSAYSIKPFLATEAEAGAGLLLVIFCIYQAYLHRIYERLSATKQG